MNQPTDEEVVRLGNLAENLLHHEGYIEIVEHLNKELAGMFLASTLDDSKGRDETFQTYHGLRLFHNKLHAYVADRKATIERNDQNNFEQEDD